MRILEVKNLKKVALDRDEWAKLLKKARVHTSGAVEPIVMMMMMMMLHEFEISHFSRNMQLISFIYKCVCLD